MENNLKRNRQLRVRFRDREWESLRAAAGRAQQPVAEFARDAVNAAARGTRRSDTAEEHAP